jgi:phosphate/sulfate permease
MPVVLPEQPAGTRIVVAVVMLYSAASIIAAVVVAHLTSSVGWGFVVAATLLLIVSPVLALALGALQRMVIATTSRNPARISATSKCRPKTLPNDPTKSSYLTSLMP